MDVVEDLLVNGKWLDEGEIISLIFLMCDDAVKAFDILTSKKSNETLQYLFVYFADYDPDYVKNKLIESLILLKNYKLVGVLGHKKSEVEKLKKKYLVNNSEFYVKLLRKKLFKMFENNPVEMTDLIRSVRTKFPVYNHLVFNSPGEMEVNVLFWITKGFISDGSLHKKQDISNLISHLQFLKKYDMAKDLLEIDQKDKKLRNGISERLLLKDNYIHDLDIVVNHACGEEPKDSESNYLMDKDNMGLCIIVNQRNFASVRLGKLRYGTNNDRDMLNICFTGFGYKIIVLENLDSKTLKESIRTIVQCDVNEKHSSLVLCVLSHGKEGAVYCVDGFEVPIKEIENMLLGEECPKLLGKPKMFFLQACQGNKFQKLVTNCREVTEDSVVPQSDGPLDQGPVRNLPPTADLLTVHATVEGYSAIRLPSGSVFIKTLCNQLLQRGNSDHLLDITTCVNSSVSSGKYNGFGMMSQVKHTLTKRLYFPYSRKHRCKAANMLYIKYLLDVLIDMCVLKLAAHRYYLSMKQ